MICSAGWERNQRKCQSDFRSRRTTGQTSSLSSSLVSCRKPFLEVCLLSWEDTAVLACAVLCTGNALCFPFPLPLYLTFISEVISGKRSPSLPRPLQVVSFHPQPRDDLARPPYWFLQHWIFLFLHTVHYALFGGKNLIIHFNCSCGKETSRLLAHGTCLRSCHLHMKYSVIGGGVSASKQQTHTFHAHKEADPLRC